MRIKVRESYIFIFFFNPIKIIRHKDIRYKIKYLWSFLELTKISFAFKTTNPIKIEVVNNPFPIRLLIEKIIPSGLLVAAQEEIISGALFKKAINVTSAIFCLILKISITFEIEELKNMSLVEQRIKNKIDNNSNVIIEVRIKEPFNIQ